MKAASVGHQFASTQQGGVLNTRQSSGARTAQKALVLFAPALFVLAAVASRGTIMADGDTYLHVAAGQWILQHKQFLYTDPFTYTYQGAPWNAPEWLSELASALMFRLFGWSGVGLLYAAAAALTTLLLARYLLRHLEPLPAVIALYLSIACVVTGVSSRPYLLGLPFLVAWTAGLLSAREENRAPHLSLLALMTVWSNVHGSFLFGLVLIGPLAAEAFFSEESNRWRVARVWLLFALGAVVAAAINPHGPWGLVAPVLFVMKPALTHVIEWQSTFFSEIGAFEILILAVLAISLSRPVRVPFFRLLLLLLLLHMALAHRRHINVFAVVAPMLLAEPIAVALKKGLPLADGRSASVQDIITPAIAAVVALVIGATRLVIPDPRVDSKMSPIKALSHVPPSILQQPVLNSDGVGGFLVWHGIRPFIDTRSELFDDAFLQNYYAIITPEKDAIVRTITKYRIRWTIFSPSYPTNKVLDSLPGWRVVYADKFAVVHARTDQPPALLPKR